MKKNITNYTFEELGEVVAGLGFKRFRTGQVFHEIYALRRRPFSEMASLPADIRKELDAEFVLECFSGVTVRVSKDGSRKYLFGLPDGKAVEAVYMPWLDEDGNVERNTLCISTMAGCPLGCAFCATGTLGFGRNLDASEIVGQALYVENELKLKLDNVVLMGMGEPLLNLENTERALDIMTDERAKLFSRRKITVSTVGIVPGIMRLAELARPVKLAISLHGTTNGGRESLMPIAAKYRLRELMDAVEHYYRRTRMPVTYEYIPFAGVNDTEQDARRLAKIAQRVPSRVNLIPYNDISFTGAGGKTVELKAPSKPDMEKFASALRGYGAAVFVRNSFGSDIEAACGQLALAGEKK